MNFQIHRTAFNIVIEDIELSLLLNFMNNTKNHVPLLSFVEPSYWLIYSFKIFLCALGIVFVFFAHKNAVYHQKRCIALKQFVIKLFFIIWLNLVFFDFRLFMLNKVFRDLFDEYFSSFNSENLFYLTDCVPI